ncbi:hypothetical protein [Vibrio owensii]|uniref:hypothetical protein n=1 Tax=Vibrio owensii TaxID=696485 RepID=UPI0018F1CC3A|nr:hypothetical protein [Vibrio owensii]
MGVSQAIQSAASYRDARDHVMSSWVERNPDGAELKALVTEKCANRGPAEGETLSTMKVESFTDCLVRWGADDLALEVKKLERSMNSYAAPLSWVTD